MPPRHLATALCAAALAAGCGSGADAGDAGLASATTGAGERPAAVVAVRDLKYKPKKVVVDEGDLVRWDMRDGSITHDVKADGFRSPLMDEGSWSYRFDTAGTYDYICSIHPFMKGTVEVRPAR